MGLPSGLPEIVGDNESVARFARFSNQYFKQDPKRAKGTLFDPVRGATALSVSRISTLGNEAIRELGESVVAKAGNTLKGWCILSVASIRKTKVVMLDVVADESGNNYYHAHIEHFPLEKSLLLEVRDELAELASDMVLMEP